jgi:hypothetical protein
MSLQRPWNTLRLLIVLILPVWGGMVGGCRSAEPTPRAVCRDCDATRLFVRSQAPAQNVEVGTECASPARMSTEEWKKILQSIRVQPKGQGFVFGSSKGPVEAAFAPEEIDYLSKALGPAFRQARPDDMIVFGLTRSRSSDVDEVTTGGWCGQGTNLLLTLANYRLGVSMPRIHDLLWKEPLRSHVSDTYEFVVGEYQVLKSDAMLGGYRQTSESSLSILYQPLLASNLTLLEPTSITSDHPHLPLEDRLQRLKRLHEQGLITDEEYRSKKQQILDQL